MDPSSGFSTALQNAVNAVSGVLTDYVLVTVLLIVAVVFTVRTRGVQFRMAGEMLHLLVRSGKRDNDRRQNDAPAHGNISSFQAFALSIASRVGTGNLAGVASAIALGGPGAVFWMWVIAILGAASAFVESTLAQLFKVKGDKSFRGGPAYYILKGLHKRWWAVTFAVLITLTFGFAFNSVQSKHHFRCTQCLVCNSSRGDGRGSLPADSRHYLRRCAAHLTGERDSGACDGYRIYSAGSGDHSHEHRPLSGDHDADCQQCFRGR